MPLDKEAKRVYMREYMKTYRKKFKDNRSNRDASFYRALVISLLLQRDGDKCCVCGKRMKRSEMSLEHVIPFSKGGKNVALNVGLSHLKCNMARNPRNGGRAKGAA